MQLKALSVLVIENNQPSGQEICDYLLQQGMQVDFAATSTLGVELARAISFDVVILNVVLASRHGFEVCRKLKQLCDPIPAILLVSDKDCLTEKRLGFAAGADDYLSKPYCIEELGLRCEALSRRFKLHQPQTICIGDLQINENQRLVTRAGQQIKLSNTDFDILITLAYAHPNYVSRQHLASKVWGDSCRESDVIRSHIYTLRQVLDKPFSIPMLKTLHGRGFKLDVS